LSGVEDFDRVAELERERRAGGCELGLWLGGQRHDSSLRLVDLDRPAAGFLVYEGGDDSARDRERGQ
jgi:hypothetical protein